MDTGPVSAPLRTLLARQVGGPDTVVAAYATMLSAARVPFALLLAPRDENRVALARILALAVIDREYSVVHPTLLPRRPATAILRDDGEFRHQVTRTFAPWVLDEVGRLSRRLLPTAAELLVELDGRGGARLRAPGADAPMRDSDGQLFEFDLPLESVDPRGFQRERLGLKRHELVRKEYERDRYMGHLSRPDLDARALAIVRALYHIDEQGRVTLEVQDALQHLWFDKLTEVMHEYALRSIPIPEYGRILSTEASLNRGRDSVFRRAGVTTGRYGTPGYACVVKYGDMSHMRAMHDAGVVRFGPATSYDDRSLNTARRDRETTREVDWDSTILPFVRDGSPPSYVGAPPRRRVTVSASLRTNFYVFCMAARVRARLFNDFQAEAAVVVRDPASFLKRVRNAVASRLPGWSVQAGAVEYFDPLNVSPSEVEVPFWKSFEYAYQEEMRIVIWPPSRTASLEPLFVELGALHDIADLVALDE